MSNAQRLKHGRHNAVGEKIKKIASGYGNLKKSQVFGEKLQLKVNTMFEYIT